MRKDFGTKELRESNPLRRGFREKSPIRALREVDHLIEKVGINLIPCVENYYQKYLDKPTPRNAHDYCLWRLRLHRRVKNDREILETLNKARNLGLFDETPGRTCWDLDFGDG